MKAPEWEWEGAYECPECGEEFFFAREDGFEDMRRDEWVLQVYHDHTEYPEGVWRAAAYKSWKGRRKPGIVKDVRQQHSEAYKQSVERRRVDKASVD